MPHTYISTTEAEIGLNYDGRIAQEHHTKKMDRECLEYCAENTGNYRHCLRECTYDAIELDKGVDSYGGIKDACYVNYLQTCGSQCPNVGYCVDVNGFTHDLCSCHNPPPVIYGTPPCYQTVHCTW